MNHQKPCHMCVNAKVCLDLDDTNDLSYHGIGSCEKGFRLLIRSGYRRPTMILIEQHNGKEWQTIGYYEPKHCPNCGREIIEYKK